MQGVEQVIRNEDKLAQEGTTTANQRFTEPRVLQSSQSRNCLFDTGRESRWKNIENEQRANGRSTEMNPNETLRKQNSRNNNASYIKIVHTMKELPRRSGPAVREISASTPYNAMQLCDCETRGGIVPKSLHGVGSLESPAETVYSCELFREQ